MSECDELCQTKIRYVPGFCFVSIVLVYLVFLIGKSIRMKNKSSFTLSLLVTLAFSQANILVDLSLQFNVVKLLIHLPDDISHALTVAK